MQKIRYEFDPHNKLVVKGSGLRGVRKVLDGQFRISGKNQLTYHIKAPVPDNTKSPHQLKLKGSWSLTKDHQLSFTLDKWRRETFGDQLTIQGEIIDVQKNLFMFATTTRTKQGLLSTYILELTGSWQADALNRLTFKVEKEGGSFDSLTFNGAWQINKKYQIIYSYQKQALTQKDKEIHTLIFKGYWDIKDKARLSYVLDCDSSSGFDFRTSAGLFKDNYIKYELGIGLSGKKEALKRIVTLFGNWKIKKSLGLVFEVEQGGRRIQSIVFGAEAKLTDRDSVSFNIRNSLNNKNIGAELELSRDIFKQDGQAFLRLLQLKRESTVMIGIGFRW
jgi:hypothetical protein